MVAPVSHTRAQHDGFAMLAVIVMVVAACLAGYWYAERSAGPPVRPESAASR
jgi:O-antigen/teichoic acid export membrane protein